MRPILLLSAFSALSAASAVSLLAQSVSFIPHDINPAGWTDIVSVNYRSASIFWIEHPGEIIKKNPETPWTKHLVDNPGPMETGRLYDIDGDGRLDILPNGTTFAAWYELLPNSRL